jgi:hypothetical protein
MPKKIVFFRFFKTRKPAAAIEKIKMQKKCKTHLPFFHLP